MAARPRRAGGGDLIPVVIPPDLAACPFAETFERSAASDEPTTLVALADGRYIVHEQESGLGEVANFYEKYWLVNPADCRSVGLTIWTTRGSPRAEIRSLTFQGGGLPSAEEEAILRQAMGGPPLDAPAFEPIPPLPPLFYAPVKLPNGLTLRASKPMSAAWREGKAAVLPVVWTRTGEAGPECPCYSVFDGSRLNPDTSGKLDGMTWQTFKTSLSLSLAGSGAVALLDPGRLKHAWLWIDCPVRPLGTYAGRAWFAVETGTFLYESTLVSARLGETGAPEVQSFLFEGAEGGSAGPRAATSRGVVLVVDEQGREVTVPWSRLLVR